MRQHFKTYETKTLPHTGLGIDVEYSSTSRAILVPADGIMTLPKTGIFLLVLFWAVCMNCQNEDLLNRFTMAAN